MIPDMYTAAVLVQSKVSIELPQHCPSARAASARAALWTPSERRDRTQMPSVLGESRESRRLNNTASHQQTAVVYIGVYNKLPSQSSSFAHNSSTPPPGDRWLTSTASSLPDAVMRVPGEGPGESGLVRDRFFGLYMQHLRWCAASSRVYV